MPFGERRHEGEVLVAGAQICAVATIFQRYGLDQRNRWSSRRSEKRRRYVVVGGPIRLLVELARSEQTEASTFDHQLPGGAFRAFLPAESTHCEPAGLGLLRDQIDHGGKCVGSIQDRARALDDFNFLE